MSARPEKLEPLPAAWPKGWVPPIQERPQQTWRMVMGYLFSSLLAIPLLKWLALPDVPMEQQIMAYILFCICTYPVVSHFSKRAPGLPVFPMICLVYGASYALPVYFGEPIINVLSRQGYVRILPADTNHAIVLCILGILSMQFGFAFFRYSIFSMLVPHLRLELDPARAKSAMLALGLGGVLILWLWMAGRIVLTGGFMSIMIAVSHLPTLCAAYLYWMYLNGELKGVWAMGLWAILIGSVGIGLSMGNVRNAVDPMITMGAVHWMVRRKINWRYVIFGLIFVLAMQSVKGEYRKLVWKQGEAKNSVVDRILIWKTLLGVGTKQAISHEDRTATAVRASVSRVDLIHLFAHAIHRSPRFVPYQYGNTYSYFLYMWVPRMFWKDKPSAQSANEFFGVAFDLQDASSVGTTSIGLPHLVEAYINFGNAGVIFIMMLFGMFYASLDRLFNHLEAGGGGIALYSTFLMNFVNIETATAATFGALPQSLFLFYLLLRMLRPQRKLVR